MAEVQWLGMYRAIVMDNNDPERRGRIRVQCPTVLGDYLSAWCEPCIPYATDYAGDYYVPPVGEGIWVQFEEGNVDKPIWNGGWYKINSSPLTTDSNPEDYRYITFKDSVLRMGQREFIFELRDGEESHTVTISADTWIGLNYISSYDEGKINDLETLLVNREWLLETRPSEENERFDEIEKLLSDLGETYNDFTQNVFPSAINDCYTQIQASYDASHGELESVVSQLNDLGTTLEDIGTRLSNIETEIDNIKNNIRANNERINTVFGWLDEVTIDGEYMFADYTPKVNNDYL